ncbi:solute carrier family 22 member 9-like [Carlito syrichta]|uniref:Solute carrier family 22 member 9-like n=1 Tax=Carlito syrichta TaxID=1868482 RepID=A0A1U7SMG3_CARSF|nr:solute carrier family 22 member 9-like [Carlito syrichta]
MGQRRSLPGHELQLYSGPAVVRDKSGEVECKTAGHCWFGRRLILRWFYFKLAIADICAAVAPTFHIYCSLRFLAGIATKAVMENNIILNSEWLAPRFQAVGMTLTSSMVAVGQIILGGLAFAISDWFILQLVISVPIFVFFLSSRWLVESARWLIINNKPEEGLKELRKVAHRNGIKNYGDILTMEVLRSTMKEELESAQKKPSLGDLFHAPNLRKRICCLSFVRFAIVLPFFGLSLNLQHLGSNVFLLQGLFGAVMPLANCVGLWALNYVGRRVSQMFFMVLLGICILVIIFVPQGEKRTD